MNIEFVDPVLPSRRAWHVVIGIAALASVLFAIGRIVDVRAHALADQARARALAAAPVVQAVVARPMPAYQADALKALDRARAPEAPALGELEAVAVVGIALRSIDVDMARHSVIVEFQAGSQAALDDYLDQLNAGHDVPAWRIARLAASEGPAAVRAPVPPATGAPSPGARLITIERTF